MTMHELFSSQVSSQKKKTGVKGTTEQHEIQANIKCEIQMENQLGLITSQKTNCQTKLSL